MRMNAPPGKRFTLLVEILLKPARAAVRILWDLLMAEREGFEPSVQVLARTTV